MIDYNKIESVIKENFKNGDGSVEIKMAGDELVKINRINIKKGSSIGEHTHLTNSEIVYVLEGEATIKFDGASEICKAGQIHYCPKGHTHEIRNDNKKTLVFIGIIPEQ